jgi:hypothetical protein
VPVRHEEKLVHLRRTHRAEAAGGGPSAAATRQQPRGHGCSLCVLVGSLAACCSQELTFSCHHRRSSHQHAVPAAAGAAAAASIHASCGRTCVWCSDRPDSTSRLPGLISRISYLAHAHQPTNSSGLSRSAVRCCTPQHRGLW